MHGYKYMQQLASYIYLLCIIITDYEKKLQRIWKKNPWHVVQARIKRFTIHLGSFKEQAISFKEQIFYCLDPLGPSRSSRGIYSAVK